MRREAFTLVQFGLGIMLALGLTTDAAADSRASIAILPGYFAPTNAGVDARRSKSGSPGLALSADFAQRQGVAIGVLVQYGPFETESRADSTGRTTFSGAEGYTTLVALVARSLAGQGTVRAFMGPGIGWLHTEVDPITVHYETGDTFRYGSVSDDQFAIYLHGGLELGPESGDHAAILGLSCALATGNDRLGSSYWTAQVGLRLRFGGA